MFLFRLFNTPRRLISAVVASLLVWGLGWMMMPAPYDSKNLSFGPFKIVMVDSTLGYDGVEYTINVTNASEQAITFSNITMKAFDSQRHMISIDQAELVHSGDIMKPGEEKILSFYIYGTDISEIDTYTFGPSGLQFAEKIEQ